MDMKTSPGERVSDAASVLIEGRELDRLGAFFSKDYRVHFSTGDAASGHTVIRKALGVLRGAFSSLHVDVRILVEDGERVSWMRTMRGVQDGPYKGFPASWKEIVWREMVTSVVRDGLIVEEWVVSDLAEGLLASRKS